MEVDGSNPLWAVGGDLPLNSVKVGKILRSKKRWLGVMLGKKFARTGCEDAWIRLRNEPLADQGNDVLVATHLASEPDQFVYFKENLYVYHSGSSPEQWPK